MSNVQYTMIK